MSNHSFAALDSPQARWGILDGNPVWEEMREAARMTHPDFLLNVVLNRDRQIAGVYAGDWERAHRLGTEAVRRTAMVPCAQLFDIVLTTNSGYPLDQNLYQSVKGMSCAAQIVKPGGAIIIATECRDGIPAHGEYRHLVHEGDSPAGILKMISQPGFARHDQWEAQLQAQVQLRADVYVHTTGLGDEELRAMLFRPCHDVAATLEGIAQTYRPQGKRLRAPRGASNHSLSGLGGLKRSARRELVAPGVLVTPIPFPGARQR